MSNTILYLYQPGQLWRACHTSKVVCLKERRLCTQAGLTRDVWNNDTVGWVCEDVMTGEKTWSDEKFLVEQLNEMEVLAWMAQ